MVVTVGVKVRVGTSVKEFYGSKNAPAGACTRVVAARPV